MADRKALIERKKILQSQPLTKWISVIETDGLNTQKKKHLVRFKQTKNIENLKTDLTTSLHPSIGPFRHIYTPAGGTEVTSLDQIEKDKEYVAGQGNQNFRKLSQVIHKNGQKGKKKSSVTSIASSSNQTSSSNNSDGAGGVRRLTLVQRHDMFVQNAKSRENKEDVYEKSSNTQNNSNSLKVKNTNLEAKFLARKVKKPLNRKPLYPVSKNKSSKTSTTKNTAESSPNISASKKLIAASAVGVAGATGAAGAAAATVSAASAVSTASAKSTVSIKGDFVRASRVSQLQAAPNSPVVTRPSTSSQSASQRSVSRENSYDSRSYASQSQSEEESDNEEESQTSSRSQSPQSLYSRQSRRRSASSSQITHNFSATGTGHSSKTPSPKRASSNSSKLRRQTAATYKSRHHTPNLGSAGSSIKSSSSPNGEDSRPTSSRPASGQSFIRHSIDRSFGQSILKRANNQSVKSVRTHDLVDRDEDAETTYSRQSIRESTGTHNMTVTSQGHGVDNNDSFYGQEVGNNGGQRQITSGSKSSLFSYKLVESPARASPQKIEDHLLDYDTDDYGLFKAKGESQETKGAKEILDSTITKIDTPVDLMKTQTILDETELGNQLAQLRAAAAAD